MGIFMTIENEEGEQLDKPFEIQKVQRHFRTPLTVTTICLQFIDTKSDSSFNPLQLSILKSELEKLSESVQRDDERPELLQVQKFCKKANDLAQRGKPVYLRFYPE